MAEVDTEVAGWAVQVVLDEAVKRDQSMNRVKLAKLLYLADLRALANGDDPVSGVTWRWETHGPFNSALYTIENRLVDAGLITRTETQNYFGTPEFRLEGPPVAELGQRTGEEYIRSLVAQLGDLSATQLKDLAYQTLPMKRAQADGQQGSRLDMDSARAEKPTGPRRELGDIEIAVEPSESSAESLRGIEIPDSTLTELASDEVQEILKAVPTR